MRKKSFGRIVLITFVINCASNFIHPITPTYIQNLGLPSYMFGVMFAAMSAGAFLFSPVWGRFADRRGRVPAVVLGTLGYGVCQVLFGYATTIAQIVAARFIGGCFSCSNLVCTMAYVVDLTTPENRTRYLSYFAAVSSVANSLGFFIGGFIGSASVLATFWAQAGALALGSLLALVLLEETLAPSATPARPQKRVLLYDWRGMARMMTLPLALFFVGVMLATFGTTGYDNAFNYYIKSELGFPSSANGIIKGVTGLLGLAANLFINSWIARRFEQNRALAVVLCLASVTLLSVTFSDFVPAFIALNIVFYLFNAMYLPLQQSLVAENSDCDYGLLSGMFNSAKCVGMVTGSLFAGFIYDVGPKLPFVYAALGFLLAAGVGYLSYLAKRRQPAD